MILLIIIIQLIILMMNDKNKIAHEHYDCPVYGTDDNNTVIITVTGQNIMYVRHDDRFLEENLNKNREKIVLADKSQTLNIFVAKNFMVRSKNGTNLYIVTDTCDGIPEYDNSTEHLIISIPTGIDIKSSSNQKKHTNTEIIEAVIDVGSLIILPQGTRLSEFNPNNLGETSIKMTLDKSAEFIFDGYLINNNF